MATIVNYYNFLFRELGDPRVEDWAFMSGPSIPLTYVAVYLFLIFIVLPKYMANRPAYDLKPVLMVYNVYQIVACIIIIYGISTSGWTTYYTTFGCQPVDYSTRPIAMRMAGYMYVTLIVKATELIETVFFILRKKFTQVSGLHVYHHISTLTVAWLGVKYGAGGMISFAPIVNSAVHIIMYTYYLLTAFGPEWSRRLSLVKAHLTEIQLVQLALIAVHAFPSVAPSCNVPLTFPIIMVPNVIVNIILFIRFYIKSYIKKQK